MVETTTQGNGQDQDQEWVLQDRGQGPKKASWIALRPRLGLETNISHDLWW